MVEPVQGEGGIQVPDEDYLTGLEKFATQTSGLFLDETKPVTVAPALFQLSTKRHCSRLINAAKGLGNGMPIGVCLE